MIHPDLGVGVDWVDTKRRTKTPTLPKRVLQKALDMEMLGEELRVLYVAFTRAKEKLIVLGSAGSWMTGYRRQRQSEAERRFPSVPCLRQALISTGFFRRSVLIRRARFR